MTNTDRCNLSSAWYVRATGRVGSFELNAVRIASPFVEEFERNNVVEYKLNRSTRGCGALCGLFSRPVLSRVVIAVSVVEITVTASHGEIIFCIVDFALFT